MKQEQGQDESSKLLRVKELAADAVCVIVAIGDGMRTDVNALIQRDPVYRKHEKRKHEKTEAKTALSDEWIRNACLFHLLEEKDALAQSRIFDYDRLWQWIRFKNYFIICNNTDGLFSYSLADRKKTVMPFGTPWLLQCEENCTDTVTEAGELLTNFYECLKQRPEIDAADLPRCPHCGKPLRFNIRRGPGDKLYCENGYLKDWISYRNWMQTTMHQKTLLLELGESFEAPGVVRFPFERMAYLNENAFLVRVNERFYQYGPELQNKAMGIAKDPAVFLSGLLGGKATNDNGNRL